MDRGLNYRTLACGECHGRLFQQIAIVLSSQSARLQPRATIDAMMPVNRSAFIAVEPCPVAAERKQIADRPIMIVKVDVVFLYGRRLCSYSDLMIRSLPLAVLTRLSPILLLFTRLTNSH